MFTENEFEDIFRAYEEGLTKNKEEIIMTNLNTHSESIHKDLWEATKDFFNTTDSFEEESLAAAMLMAFELIEQVNAAPGTLAGRMASISQDIKELVDIQENLIKPIHTGIAKSKDDQWETFEDYKRLGFTFEETIQAIQGISNAADRGSQKDTPVVSDEVMEAVQEHFRDAEWGSFEEHYSLGAINAFRAIELGKLEDFKNNFPKVVSDAKETATFFSSLADEFLK